MDTLEKLRGDALTETTVKQIGYKLRDLARNSMITKPDAVKFYIATTKNQKTKQPLSEETKNKFAYAYDKYCEKQQIKWEKPYYKVEEKTPLIPTPDNVNAIISTATTRYTTIFTILTEIGAEGKELENVTQNDINTETGEIRIRGTKGHTSGTYKLKQRTAEMLKTYLHKNPQEHPFPQSRTMGKVWIQTRRRAIKKYCNPELAKIPLKNLRNYSGARLYLTLPIRDPIAVMRHLRHKKLETTMHYLRGITLTYEEDANYICRTTNNVKEDTELIENGFTFVTERDGIKLYRKRK